MEPVLHRISIQPLSRPLPSWNSPTDREFFLSFQEALKAYKSLAADGVFDFDINAENMYFQSTKGTFEDGDDRKIFFADFDLCPGFDGMVDVTGSETGTLVEISSPNTNSGQGASKITRYKSITPVSADGTIMFMATEILQAISQGKPSIPRNKYHGLESLIWVFIYNVCMRYVKGPSRYSATLRERLDACFGGEATLSDILSARAESQEEENPRTS